MIFAYVIPVYTIYSYNRLALNGKRSQGER